MNMPKSSEGASFASKHFRIYINLITSRYFKLCKVKVYRMLSPSIIINGTQVSEQRSIPARPFRHAVSER